MKSWEMNDRVVPAKPELSAMFRPAAKKEGGKWMGLFAGVALVGLIVAAGPDDPAYLENTEGPAARAAEALKKSPAEKYLDSLNSLDSAAAYKPPRVDM